MLDLNYAACQRHSKLLCGWGSYFIFLFLQSEKDLICCTLSWMRFQPGIKGHFSLSPSPLSPPLRRQPWMANGEALAVGGGRAWVALDKTVNFTRAVWASRVQPMWATPRPQAPMPLPSSSLSRAHSPDSLHPPSRVRGGSVPMGSSG